MKNIIIFSALLFIFFSCKKSDNSNNIPIDKDGNVYSTVTIGNQVWMAENLKTTKYRDGSSIYNATSDFFLDSICGAYCWYDNDISNKTTYGALYNFYAIEDERKLCPIGWHIPSREEWMVLINHLGGLNRGLVLKLSEEGSDHWIEGRGTNESGFTALPSGIRDEFFSSMGSRAYFWSSTFCKPDEVKNTENSGWYFRILMDPSINISDTASFGKWLGLSIRCIKD